MTSTRVIGLLIGALLLLSDFRFPAASIAQDPQASGAKPIRVELTVTTADNTSMYVTGLSKDQITVRDEKVPQEITLFAQLEQPMSIGLVVDLSENDYKALLASTEKGFLSFMKANEGKHEYFMLGFDGDVHLAGDWFRTAEQAAGGFAKLASLRPSKRTAVYDALRAALVKVGQGSQAKRVIILISNSRDNSSTLKREDLMEAVMRSDALVYAVSVRRDVDSAGSPDRKALDRLCSITGGLAVNPRSRVEFEEFFDRLSTELKSQYTVSFSPTGIPHNGEWHRLDLNAKPLEFKTGKPSKRPKQTSLAVRTREGIYER